MNKKNNISRRLSAWFLCVACFCVACVLISLNLNDITADNDFDDSVQSIYQTSSQLYVGDSQLIAIEFNNEHKASSAVLNYSKVDGGDYSATPLETSGAFAIFQLSFYNNNQIGTYNLKSVDFGMNKQNQMPIEKNNDLGYSFKVEESVGLYDSSIVPASSLNVDNDFYNGDEVETLDNQASTMLIDSNVVNSANEYKSNPINNFVVAIVPGHGGSDPGACAYGYQEKWLNLSIANACNDELRKYSGVSTYMTRTGDEYVGLQERVERARWNGANLFLCLHNNAGGGSGAEVWVQHSGGWHSEFNSIGCDIGNRILHKLAANLGLNMRGLFERYCTDGSTYPDGSQGDYFTVLFWSRYYSIPGILVEHAFMDGGGVDLTALYNDGNLDLMGRLDAQSIAEYYGFTKDEPSPHVKDMVDGSVTLSWDTINGAEKYGVSKYENGVWFNYDLDVHSTEYTINNLTNGKDYQFLVQSYKNGRWSSYELKYLLSCKLLPRPLPILVSQGDGTVTLQWNNINSVDKYGISEYSPDGFWINYDLNIVSEDEKIDYTLTNLANERTHYFLVQACMSGNWSSYEDNTKYVVVELHGCDRPYDVVATPGPSSIEVSWKAPPGIEKYAVSTMRDDGSWWNHTLDWTGTRYKITGLEEDKNYTLIINSYALGSWSPTAPSEYIYTHTLWFSPHPKVTYAKEGRVDLCWDKIQCSEKYGISEYFPDGHFNNIDLNYKSSLETVSYTLNNVVNERDHYYLVQAYVDGHWSKYWDSSLYVKACPSGHDRPYNVKAVPGYNSIDVSWDSPSGAERFAISTMRDDGSWWNHTLTWTGNSYKIMGLEEDKNYTVIVNSYAMGQWSPTASSEYVYTHTNGVSPHPKLVSAIEGTVTLCWDAILNASKYGISEYFPDGHFNNIDLNYKSSKTTITYTIEDVANERPHYYLVQANVGGSWSKYWDSSLYVYANPKGHDRPYNVKTIAGTTSIDVSWEAPSGIERYAVSTMRSDGSWCNHTLNCVGTKYTINGLNPDTKYTIIVNSFAIGQWSPTTSSEYVYESTKASTPKPKVVSTGDGSAVFQWDKIFEAEKYGISELLPDGNWINHNLNIYSSDDVVKYELTDIANMHKHTILVQSFINGSWSTYTDSSLYVDVTPQGEHVRPYNTKVIPVVNGFNVSWSKCPGTTCYSVSTRIGGGKWLNHTLTCTELNYSIDCLKGGTTYEIVVTAYIMGSWVAEHDEDIITSTTLLDPQRPIPTVKVITENSITLEWGAISGASKYGIYTVNPNGTLKCYSDNCTGLTYKISGLTGGSYKCLVRAWIDHASSWSNYNEGDIVNSYISIVSGARIMTSSRTYVDQIVRYYNSKGHAYPSDVYSAENRGAPTIYDFTRICVEEATVEGVDPAVLFCQAMKETGWLQFGGLVQAWQCNFGGLGATGTGVYGAVFPDVRTGLRAQVQHLKCYASVEPLKNQCVDERWQVVVDKWGRGSAPCVEDLNGKWAVPGDGYGQAIVRLMNELIQK